jgi:hypothetical protein
MTETPIGGSFCPGAMAAAWQAAFQAAGNSFSTGRPMFKTHF